VRKGVTPFLILSVFDLTIGSPKTVVASTPENLVSVIRSVCGRGVVTGGVMTVTESQPGNPLPTHSTTIEFSGKEMAFFEFVTISNVSILESRNVTNSPHLLQGCGNKLQVRGGEAWRIVFEIERRISQHA